MITIKNELSHTHDCINVPDIHSGNVHCIASIQKSEYLKTDNYLNEFQTDTEKNIARTNLGIKGNPEESMHFKGEVQILPIDDVELGDTYLCGNKLYLAVKTERHFVKWHEINNELNWS